MGKALPKRLLYALCRFLLSGCPNVVFSLHPGPGLGAKSKDFFEIDGDTGGYSPFAVDDLVDFAWGTPQLLR